MFYIYLSYIYSTVGWFYLLHKLISYIFCVFLCVFFDKRNHQTKVISNQSLFYEKCSLLLISLILIMLVMIMTLKFLILTFVDFLLFQPFNYCVIVLIHPINIYFNLFNSLLDGTTSFFKIVFDETFKVIQ